MGQRCPTRQLLTIYFHKYHQKPVEITNPEAHSLLPLQTQFELAKQYSMVENGHDVSKLRELVKTLLTANAVQKYHYQELLKKQWGF